MSRSRFSAPRRIASILAFALALALAAGSASAASILGEWAIKMDYQGNMIPAKLIFEQKDGALAGKWVSERGESELSKISFEGDVLKFTRKVKFQDQEFDLDYEGKVDGTKLTGKFVTPMGEMEAGGELAKPAEPAPAPAPAPAEATKPAEGGNAAAGEWDLVVNSQLGENKRKLTITPDLKGTYASDFGKFDTKNMKVEGDKLTFDVTLTMDGNSLELKFDGKISGDKLEGNFASDMGDATVKGTKAGGAPAAAPSGPISLPGLWKMNIETPDGATTEGDLTVTEEGGKFKGVLSTQLGEIKIDEIKLDGSNVSFDTTVDFGGNLVPIKFAGSADGGKLKGVVNLSMDGQEMELPVTGAKSAAVAAAAPAAGGLAGLWKMNIETPDGATTEGDLTVTEEGGKFKGLLSTQLGEIKIDEIKVDGGNVSFATTVDFGGNLVPIKFAGSTEGDKLKGVVNLSMDGQEMELPVTGSKSAAVAAAAPAADGLSGAVNLPGLWKLSIETPDGATTEGDLTVAEADGKITGLLNTQLGEIKIDDVKLDGNAVSFATTVDFGGTIVPIKFAGTTAGEELKGTVNLSLDGQEMELPVKGAKSSEKPGLTGPVDLPGSWKLEVETPDGAVSQSEMKVAKEGEKFSAELVTELGSGKIPEITVDGNKVSFKTEIDFGGQMVPLSFAGTTGGGKLQGVVKVTFEGQEMELPLKGSKDEAKVADGCCTKPTCGAGCKGSAGCGACCKGGDEAKPKETSDACCAKPSCGAGCKGSAGCGACCKA